MHNEKWLQNIPDELPSDLEDQIGIEDAHEIRSLHSKLLMENATVIRRKKELFEKCGLMLRDDNDVAVRLNLIVEMFIGILSPERLRFEIRYQEIVGASLEAGYSEYLEMKRRENGSKDLHLPGGRVHKVTPKKKADIDWQEDGYPEEL